jgi:hypothetical protein
MKVEFSRQVYEKYSNTKFHENPSRGGRVGTCGQMDGRTDRHDKVAFRNFVYSLTVTCFDSCIKPRHQVGKAPKGSCNARDFNYVGLSLYMVEMST